MKPIAIVGTTESGKTTLARKLSAEFWRQGRRRSLVLDPNTAEWRWGAQAWVTADAAKFEKVVWSVSGCLVIIEEASSTIQRDSDKIPLFTRIRHSNHQLLVVCHSGRDLLPEMRQQIGTIYLFRVEPKAAEMWAECLCEPRLEEASSLGQFEFLHFKLFGKPEKLRLRL